MADGDAKKVVLDLDAASDHRGPTVGHVLDAARRIEQGIEVSDEDRAAVARFNAAAEKTMNAFNARHAETVARIGAAFQGVNGKFAQVLGGVQAIGAALAPVLAQIGAALREMPPRLEAAVGAMARHGWYVDGDQGLDELETLRTLIDAGDTGRVDELLMAHFEGRLDAIEDALVKELPRREKILRRAIAAHRRGDYELSIPVLLIQADGACVDLTDHHFFQKSRGSQVPEVAAHIAATQGPGDALFLGPISLELPINASEKGRERIAVERGWTTWKELNRHQVLHGESVDYGTRLNSLKAISLLNYLVSFLPGDGQAGAGAAKIC